MLLAPEYVIHKRVRVPLGFDYSDAVARLGYRIDIEKTRLVPCIPEYDLGGSKDLCDDDFLALCCLDRLIRGETAYQEFEEFMFSESYCVEGKDYEIQAIPITLDFSFESTSAMKATM